MNPFQGIHQIEQRHVVQQCFIRLDRLGRGLLTAEHLAPHFFLAVELPSGFLIRLVFEQAPHEFFAGVRPLFLIIRRLIGRQQHFGLDLQQRGRHDEEFSRHGEIQLLHGLYIFEVLLRDQRDGNIVDVDFVFLDEMEQEIERSFEILDTDLIRQLCLLKTFYLGIHGRPYTNYWGPQQA